MMWKLIWTDNFDRDYVEDKLIYDGIYDEVKGKAAEAALQALCHPQQSDWYRLVPRDYKLKVREQ